MKPRTGVVFCAICLWLLVGSPAGPEVVAQEAPRQSSGSGTSPGESTRWILGTWKGAHQDPAISSDSTTFEFREESGVITWKMARSGVRGFRPVAYQASGVVTNLGEAVAELDGRYGEEGTEATARGKPLKYSLTRSGDTLEGSVVGAAGRTFYVLLKKVQ